jgi:hypothetical protein
MVPSQSLSGRRCSSSFAAATVRQARVSVRPSTTTTRTADHRPSRNVSGSAVRDRDPPICEFFQRTKAIRHGALPRLPTPRHPAETIGRRCAIAIPLGCG